MNPYDYTNILSGVETKLLKETNNYLQFEVRFQSALDTGHRENSIVIGHYYLPKCDKKAPLTLLVHGMGDYSVLPCRLLARKLLKENIACFIPYLTVHSRRLPREMKKHMPYLTPDEWFDVYRLSVIDIRQIIDWAETQNEIDAGKIFISGISFGGFVSAITMGIDNRIKAGIFIVIGGNSNKLSRLSKNSQYRKRYPRTEAEHNRVMDSYRNYLKEVNEHGFENVSTDDKSFLTDPLTFARYLKDRPVLMINALKDKYIPVETAIEFHEAIGNPPIIWINSGHVTLWLKFNSVYRHITEFLNKYI